MLLGGIFTGMFALAFALAFFMFMLGFTLASFLCKRKLNVLREEAKNEERMWELTKDKTI
jgi:hypothetical protein